MRSISAATSIQAQAYVSTVALFLVFSCVPKEEKAYLRLPSTWRDLWAELFRMRKEQIDVADREVLRELRSLVVQNDHAMENIAVPKSNGYNIKISSNKTSNTQASPSLTQEPDDPSDHLKAIWSAKVSTPSYSRMLNARKNLPIWNFKDDLLATIEKSQVVIVCGETGCGKSTQVPAFILGNELSNGRPCRVYCTEPRRISAISLARRVSEELGESRNDVGSSRSLVGYAIRLESHITNQTRLVYATTGIVMRMLERSDDLGDITHLVLDEVHERSIDSDFLLIVLRKLMTRRPNLKVLLMSATVDAKRFSTYLDGAPFMTIPGRTFPVETRYLEDAIEVTKFDDRDMSSHGPQAEDIDDIDEVSIDQAGKQTSAIWFQGYSAKTRNTLAKLDEYRIGYDFIVKLLVTVATSPAYANYSKAVLVFLPGIAEIRRLNDMLLGHQTFSHQWRIYALHSTISMEEQEQAFLVPPKGIRKIVLATNIAETGVTIPDVTCVIDTGKHKEMR
jgi:ATP-dependent RNA helicase DHX29